MDTGYAQTNPVQEKMAKTITTMVIVGTCLFGALGIGIAIKALSVENGGVEQAKDILQILFSAILPLFGTWIGTILAYYFSRENLAAANETVKHLVDSLTSDKKLETIKAKDVMIPADKLIYREYKTGTDDTTLNLKEDFLDFLNAKNIQRIILLDEDKCAKYVLHRSTIQEFIVTQSYANGSISTNALTFADMKATNDESILAILKDGVKFIREDANLSEAKVLIRNYVSCSDVFITKNGLKTEPVFGWITDRTITENSVV